MEIIFFWLIFSFIAAYIADKKGRSGVGFFLLSLLLSPLIGIIVALIVDENTSKVEEQNISTGDHQKCPFCAETIKREAIVCRYCGRDVLKPSKATKPSKAKSGLITLSEYAATTKKTEQEIISDLQDGRLDGQLVDGTWMVQSK